MLSSGYFLSSRFGLIVAAMTSQDSPPLSPSPGTSLSTLPEGKMRAVGRHHYGRVEDVRLITVSLPRLRADDVLVRVQAVSLNTSDVESATGTPFYARIFGLFRPSFPVLGTDISGVVEAVGPKVTAFYPGDEVMGDIMGCNGGLAQLVAVKQELLLKKPKHLSFEEASCFLQAAAIAYQGIVESEKAQPGAQVLVIGGGGGSGSWAIQLAKHLGAQVTAVDNERKLALMQELGADQVIDYHKEAFTQLETRFDLILDLVGKYPLRDCVSSLAPKGKYFLVGGPMSSLFRVLLVGPFLAAQGKKVRMLAVRTNGGVEEMLQLHEQGKLRPIISERFSLERAPEAITQLAAGRALGKLVVQLASE